MMICWNPVTTNCDGGPESAIIYRHKVALIPPQGFFPCTVDGVETTCAEPAQAPVWVETPFTDECTAVPEPGPGELMLLRTTAIDEAGNEDCGR
jgi:hypothetical protein